MHIRRCYQDSKARSRTNAQKSSATNERQRIQTVDTKRWDQHAPREHRVPYSTKNKRMNKQHFFAERIAKSWQSQCDLCVCACVREHLC